jgi:hypothetical protein
MSAINKLRKAGLLEQAISPETLAKLRVKLDWRTFVRLPDYTLINLPTNYYGVAFSIARLRFLMGWDEESHSVALLQKMVAHYQTFSQFGFADETDGQGRFDRYSVLLIGEICQRFIETGIQDQITPEMRGWLRNAVDVILLRLNNNGDGFDYGRSIGAYGDTAFVEVLSAAAYLGLLTDKEKKVAYSFSSRVANKYVTFWYDQDTKAVNLWDKGRRTDGYRGKPRIMGETLSLSHQIIYTNNEWNAMGYQDQPPMSALAFYVWLLQQPRFTTTWYSKGEYERALITFRDKLTDNVFSLNIVNGASGQHRNNPYYPIPYSTHLIQGSADATFPQLVPLFTLEDGTQLMPLSFIKGITTERHGNALNVKYHMTEVDRLGASTPTKDDRMKVDTTYRLDTGVITRTETYTPTTPLAVKSITMEFASFSGDVEAKGNTIYFRKGDVYAFNVTGLSACKVDSVEADPVYRSPMKQMKTRVTCTTEQIQLDKPLTIRWTMRYH